MNRLALLFGLVLLSAVALAGCLAPRVTLVNPGTPVRLAEPAAAKVYVPDGNGGWVEGAEPVQIPAGWYCLPPPSMPATRPAK
jgi:hypothetical protein